MSDDDDVGVLVVDNGAFRVRAGPAGDDAPRFQIEPDVCRTAPCRYPADVIDAMANSCHPSHDDLLVLRGIVHAESAKERGVTWCWNGASSMGRTMSPPRAGYPLPDGEAVAEVLPQLPPGCPPFVVPDYSPWSGIHRRIAASIGTAAARRFPAIERLVERPAAARREGEQRRDVTDASNSRRETEAATASSRLCDHRTDSVDPTSTGTTAPVTSGRESRGHRDDIIAAAVDAMTAPPELQARRPMIHKGVITDWDRAEAMWALAAADIFGTECLSSGAMPKALVLVPPHVGPTQVRRTCEVFLETMGFCGISLQTPCLPGLFAMGLQTGMHVLTGAGYSAAMPAWEGRPLPMATAVSPVCGNDVTDALLRMLQRRMPDSNISWTVAEDVKRSCGLVAESAEAAAAMPADQLAARCRYYDLPESMAGYTGGPELVRCNEALFAPAGVSGLEGPGLAEMVMRSYRSLDPDLDQEIALGFAHLGGAAVGATDRLKHELQSLVMERRLSQRRPFRIRAPPSGEQKLAPWVGGSIFASLSTMQDSFVTADAIAEGGLFAAFKHPMHSHHF